MIVKTLSLLIVFIPVIEETARPDKCFSDGKLPQLSPNLPPSSFLNHSHYKFDQCIILRSVLLAPAHSGKHLAGSHPVP